MNILQQAQWLVDGARQKGYGSPDDCFGRTAEIFYQITGIRLSKKQVALFNVSQKLARMRNMDKIDNDIDTCGYLYAKTKIK